jgi:hypothetical protein
MAKLLKKLQIQEEGGDPDIDAVKVSRPQDSKNLKVYYHPILTFLTVIQTVLAKHNVKTTDALVQDILAWKRQDSD